MWLCSICPHYDVVQLCCCGDYLTSKFSFLFFWFIPACINIALALLILVCIFLSTTELCWGVPGAVNSKVTPRCCLSHYFWRLLFSPLLSSLILFTSMSYLLDKNLDPLWYHSILVTFPFQKKAVTAVTELIHCNQPMSFSSSTFIYERNNINEYPVPWSVWYSLHLFWHIC